MDLHRNNFGQAVPVLLGCIARKCFFLVPVVPLSEMEQSILHIQDTTICGVSVDSIWRSGPVIEATPYMVFQYIVYGLVIETPPYIVFQYIVYGVVD